MRQQILLLLNPPAGTPTEFVASYKYLGILSNENLSLCSKLSFTSEKIYSLNVWKGVPLPPPPSMIEAIA